MNKKRKIIVIVSMLVFMIPCLLIEVIYNSRDNSIMNTSSQNSIEDKLDISIDESKLNIFYFYVGQADCTLIMNKGEVMLIDAGDKTDGALIVDFLKQIGIKKINYVIGTHSDDDHIGGLATVIQNIEIGKLYMPKKDSDNQAYIDLNNTIDERNIKKEYVKLNDCIKIGECDGIVKWVSNSEEYSDNNSSIVIQLNYKEKKYLFTGDIEKTIESKLIDNIENIDVLKVAHHGSDTSTSEKFLESINPKVVVISSGSRHKDFPNIKCLKRIVKNVKLDDIYITERDGTIWIESDGLNKDTIKKLDELNLDGAKSNINSEELNKEYLESLMISKIYFLQDCLKYNMKGENICS